MLYRILTSLRSARGKRIPKGEVSKLDWISQSSKDTLLKKGRISPVSAPPVIIIPEWEERAKVLEEKFQIVYLDELLCADLEEVSEELGVSVQEIKDLMSYLVIRSE